MMFIDQQEGRIVSVYTVDDGQAGFYRERGFLEIADTDDVSPATHYVDGEQVKARVDSPIRVANNTLSGIPVPAQLQLSSDGFKGAEIRESTLVLTVDEPGAYVVYIEPTNPRFKPWVKTLEL